MTHTIILLKTETSHSEQFIPKGIITTPTLPWQTKTYRYYILPSKLKAPCAHAHTPNKQGIYPTPNDTTGTGRIIEHSTSTPYRSPLLHQTIRDMNSNRGMHTTIPILIFNTSAFMKLQHRINNWNTTTTWIRYRRYLQIIDQPQFALLWSGASRHHQEKTSCNQSKMG